MKFFPFNHCIRKKIFSIIVFVFLSVSAFAQTHRIDSLRNQLATETKLDKQLSLVLALCSEHPSMPDDSLLKYILLAQKIAVHGSPEDFTVKNFYAIYLSKEARVDESIPLTDSLLKAIPADKKFDDALLRILNNKAIALVRSNRSKESIEYALIILKKAEEIHDTLWVARAHSLMGWSYMELDKHNEAISWLRKGIYYTSNEAILEQCGFLFSNIASSYNNVNQTDSAFYFIEKALKYSRKQEVLSLTANALNIRAAMYIKQKNFSAAENDMQEALKIREQIGDALFVISDMAQLSSFYASIKKTDKGIALAQKGIIMAREKNNLSKLIFLYSALSENYYQANLLKEYGETLVKIIDLKDSLSEKNSADAIAGLETKYELQKKENIIIQQESKITRNRYITIGLIIFVVLISMLIGLLYRNRQLVQLRKMESDLVEQKILATEAVKQAEENERKRIAADLHDNLGSFAAAITSNVKYLKEGVASKEEVTLQLEENAQNMVSQLSDTIWVLKNEHLPFTKLADRFKVWMQRLIKNYPEVKYHYNEEILNDVEFTPVKILHVFLILKECVTNALKHSNCTDLKINFISNKNLQITIEDNGKGIENNAGEGSGIENIKYRAAECGWNVEWKKASPTGTCVLLTSSTTK